MDSRNLEKADAQAKELLDAVRLNFIDDQTLDDLRRNSSWRELMELHIPKERLSMRASFQAPSQESWRSMNTNTRARSIQAAARPRTQDEAARADAAQFSPRLDSAAQAQVMKEREEREEREERDRRRRFEERDRSEYMVFACVCARVCVCA